MTFEVGDPKAILFQRIVNDFIYHPPEDEETIAKYEKIRNMGYTLACELTKTCPYSRELSLALTALEEVVMWANASIARN